VSQHLEDGISVVVHDVSAESDDWLHYELDKASLEGGSIISLVLSLPFLSLLVVVVITPEFLHHLVEVYLELVSVDSGKSGQGEGPTEESRTKGDCASDWINLLGLTHIVALVGGDDNVGVLNDSLEVLIHGLSIDLELEDTSIDLVDEKNGLDLLTQGLSQDSLCLHTDTLDVIDDD
jgi:hypothetical protein